MSVPLIPVAQYLRMSTEHQQYSVSNQTGAIKDFCERRQFVVVQTYKDAGKSGLAIKDRPRLIQLLRDVVNKPVFKAVIVYDVSRWGRFQDTDEAAHYEFICRSSGVPVYYCAEQFGEEFTVSNSILKGLKRVMAAEYSRELGEKCYRGQLRLVKAGFKCGGTAPYGLRRLLVSSTGEPKQILLDGQRKSLQEERVLLVPGTPEEIETVRKIFHWFVDKHWDMKMISAHLVAKRVPIPSRCFVD
jgi:DNA invertase Pin-like site-specific DNA recombinase